MGVERAWRRSAPSGQLHCAGFRHAVKKLAGADFSALLDGLRRAVAGPMCNHALRAHDPLHSPWCLKVLRWNEGGRRFGCDDFHHAVRREHLVDARAVQRVQRAAAHVKDAFSGAGHRRSSSSEAHNRLDERERGAFG